MAGDDFDDSLLDDERALAPVDADLRRLAESGARVRREVEAAAGAEASLDNLGAPRAVVAAGVDARLLRAVLEPSCPVPFVAWPGPGLPGWAGTIDLVLVLAPGGADAAATSAVTEAVRRGCGLVVACPPHSVLAEHAQGRYSVVLPTHTDDPLAAAVVMLQAMHRIALGPEVNAESVAGALDDVAIAASPARDISANPAKEVALTMAGALPLIWGGSVLAARAARRVAEMIRRHSGLPALAADAEHLLPVLASSPGHDVFADPFADPYLDGPAPTPPALVVLDDGADAAVVREQRGRLRAVADQHRVRTHTVTAAEGPDVARYASLLSTGSYAAVYLGVGLGHPQRR